MNRTTLRMISGSLMTLVVSFVAAGNAAAALISTPGLTAFVFWEFSGPAAPKIVAGAGPKMVAQLGVLSGISNDFVGVPNEWYDVFFSDANGAFNLNGNYVTVEARYDNATGGGGLNLGAVDMMIGATPVRADVLTSWVGLGGNYVSGSEALAVDPADVPPGSTTFTTMGNTANTPARMRVTVTWSRFVPEPTSAGLLLLGLGCIAGVRRRSAR